MLTPEAVNQLLAPFPFGAHEWLKGFVYVTEYDITRRLFDVDPNWCWELRELRETVIATQTMYIAHGRLTICGVSRDGIGQAVQELTKDGARPMGEAGKSATTDAFKRAARMFGVGNYLLNNPPACGASPTPQERKAFEAWLQKQGGMTVAEVVQHPDPINTQSNPDGGRNRKSVRLLGWEKKTGNNGKPYYVFSGHGLDGVVFSRDFRRFNQADYNTRGWEEQPNHKFKIWDTGFDASATVVEIEAGKWEIEKVDYNPAAVEYSP
jgi:hypothetical protein